MGPVPAVGTCVLTAGGAEHPYVQHTVRTSVSKMPSSEDEFIYNLSSAASQITFKQFILETQNLVL